MSQVLVCNLFGGPGAGKSTLAAGVFAKLKVRGVNAELVREYAKDVVWEGRNTLFDDPQYQLYIFAKQFKRLQDVAKSVDIVVTDSPLFLSLVYGGGLSNSFINLVLEAWGKYRNSNFFVTRLDRPYNPSGRNQTAAEAVEIDSRIMDLLHYWGVDYTPCSVDPVTFDRLTDDIAEELIEEWSFSNGCTQEY